MSKPQSANRFSPFLRSLSSFKSAKKWFEFCTTGFTGKSLTIFNYCEAFLFACSTTGQRYFMKLLLYL